MIVFSARTDFQALWQEPMLRVRGDLEGLVTQWLAEGASLEEIYSVLENISEQLIVTGNCVMRLSPEQWAQVRRACFIEANADDGGW